MIKRLNLSLTKKLIWLAFLTMTTLYVTNRANQNDIKQLKLPVVNMQEQTGTSAPPSIADIPSDFRSSYQFNELRSAKKSNKFQ